MWAQSIRAYQRLLLSGYALGFVGMLIFNANCYAGTFIGCGAWALIWPLYVPAVLVLHLLGGTPITWEALCVGSIGR